MALNYLSALGAHRIAHLEPLEGAVAAEACIKEAPDRIAMMLESKQAITELKLPVELVVLQVPRAPANEALEYLYMLRAQLSLALQLVPQLRASANELSVTRTNT